MARIVPTSRPQWPAERVRCTAEAFHKKTALGACYLVGDRGYFNDSMGVPARNDRGIYDDAIWLVSDFATVAFNANTDPSVSRPRIATLKTGLWSYKVGIHGLSKPEARRYRALVQAAPVTVERDGAEDDTGYFGINIHRGSRTSTSSAGCQTIWPDQWESFIALVQSEMKRAAIGVIPYALVEVPG